MIQYKIYVINLCYKFGVRRGDKIYNRLIILDNLIKRKAKIANYAKKKKKK